MTDTPRTTTADAPAHPPAHDPRYVAAREERLGELSGDRPCAACGFNLTGQLIVREPHYRMVIVRCPECSTVASLQEYPLLGRWAGRWAALLAALWFLALCGLFAGSAGALTGTSFAVAEDLCSPLATRIGVLHQEHVKADLLKNPSPPPPAGSNPADDWGSREWYAAQRVDGNMWVDNSWWKPEHATPLIAEMGGIAACLSPRAALAYWPFVFLLFPIGCAWSVALLHVPRRRVWLFALVILGVCLCITALASLNQGTRFRWQGSVPAHDLAQQALGWLVNAAGALLYSPALAAGLLAGRSLCRALIRLLLPPRLRGPLAALWLADGLLPPRGPREA